MTGWQDRPILVTGATGLLGGWLAQELLALGARVVVLVRDEVPDSYFRLEGIDQRCVIVRGELADLLLLERTLLEYEIDAVFHLAAQTQVGVAQRGPYATLEANVRGTYTLLEAARRCGTCRAIVVASSDKAYGESKDLPYSEMTPLGGSNPYDASKAAADVIARSFALAYELPLVVTRCGNVFGGGDLNWARIVPGVIRSLLRGERPVIRSDGGPVRDYMYVADAAHAYVCAAERAFDLRGEAFNFGLERPVSVLEIVDLIAGAVGVKILPDVRGEAHGEIERQYLSAGKARDVLAWTPSFSLEAGLAETVQWYRAYLDRSGGRGGAASRPNG